ncbi:hypothetical protein [Chitinophaga sp. OAE865]|uniref:tetratricopeptide repeat protein n=1 Tax=Chitinophaga sp. OAE865 TaxID=2817898 RepID=UPI001AE1F433
MIVEIKERRVIPNWRDFKRTCQLGELNFTNSIPSNKRLNFNIDRAIADWKRDENIGNAADLINAAFISGINDSQEIREAINFIHQNKNAASPSLLSLTARIFPENIPNNQTSLLELDIETVNGFKNFINNNTLHKLIHKTKLITHNESHNPISWVELARLYSMVGQEGKAEKAINIALSLSPHNRFVLRSATRLFIHNEKFDKALFFLRKSDRTKADPWLTSAHIATSSMMERFSPLINSGKMLLASNNFSNYDLTELASTIGTLELKNSSFKNARPYIEKAKLAPNDNSLAQLEWLSKEDNRLLFNPQNFTNVVNPFEAFAIDHLQKGNWKEAFTNCLKWFLDIPYSKRPVQLGAYIAGSLLDDIETAITLLQAGIKANPNDPVILNNLIYYHIISNDTKSAELYLNNLKSINVQNLSDENKVMLLATFGLVAFRTSQNKKGEELYERAISSAEPLKTKYMKISATLNYARELIISNSSKKDIYIKLISEMEIDSDYKDLIYVQKKILSQLK